jgi:glycine/D-amino acid oxidase-like deaminating enzyme
MLSWFLHKEGKTFLVMDEPVENTASKVAAGVINPVTGRRYSITWMAEELLDFAPLAYKELGTYLGKDLLFSKSIIDFFPSPQMRNAFIDRLSENDTYLHAFPDQDLLNPFFQYEFGSGEIKPAFTVHFNTLLTEWRQQLLEKNCLRQEKLTPEELTIKSEGVQYHDITAEKIIFCDGTAIANNPWFSLLPFSANKGEAVFIHCEELPRQYIYKKGMLLVPLAEENLYWVGSNYQWEFTDGAPSEKFYNATTDLLKQWLKKPFTVVDHKAAIRPATVERRPFVGFHPQYPAIGILNGMGTKGASLAPFFAHQLVQNMVYNFPIAPEADVHRFQRILSKH